MSNEDSFSTLAHRSPLDVDTSRAVIVTARFTMRPHRIEDFADYLPLWTQPEPADTVAPMLLSAEDAWARLLRWVGHWCHFGYGPFLVIDPRNQEIVGEGGAAHFYRGVGAHFDAAPESGWRVIVSRRGQGIAAEAMQAALDWFDRTVRIRRTVCLIHEQNARSIRVAQRIGYRQYGMADYRDMPALLFEREARGL